MQLKRQSVEAWQNEKHYSKGNNTSENPVPRQEISNQSTMWSTKVRSGHNIYCLCSFLLEFSSCRITYENCYKSSGFFSIKSEVSGWIWEIPTILSQGTFILQPYRSFFSKILIRSAKCIMWSSIQVLPNQVSTLWESHAKVHKKPSESLGADSILRLEISIYCLSRNFNWFPLYFAQCSFKEMETTFIKFQNESLTKNIGQELLIVNNSVQRVLFSSSPWVSNIRFMK